MRVPGEAMIAFDPGAVICDIHPWMRAYISVLSNPFYAVTGEDGTYEIKDLPAGDYEIEAVHGKLKSTSGKLSVVFGDKGLANRVVAPAGSTQHGRRRARSPTTEHVSSSSAVMPNLIASN